MMGSDGKKNTTLAGVRDVRTVALSISAHEETQSNRVYYFFYF